MNNSILSHIADEVRLLDVAAAKDGLPSNSSFNGHKEKRADIDMKFKKYGQDALSATQYELVSEMMSTNHDDALIVVNNENGLKDDIFQPILMTDLPEIDLNDPVTLEKFRSMCIDLNQSKKSNLLLVGAPGVGKSYEMFAFIRYLKENDVPGLSNLEMKTLNLQDLAKDTKMQGQMEERLAEVVATLNDPTMLIVIDEIQQLLNKDNHNSKQFVDAVRSVLAGKAKAKVIGTCIDTSYQKITKDFEDLERRFSVQRLYPPNVETLGKIIDSEFNRIQNDYGIGFDPKFDFKKFLLKYNDKLVARIQNPDATITVLDKAAAIAKTDKMSYITEDFIKQAASQYSGFVPEFFNDNKTAFLDKINKVISENYIGQEPAVRSAVESVTSLVCNITPENKPAGVSLFLGSGGLGKTELVNLLAKGFFGDSWKSKLLVLNGGELSEKHTTSKILGSPPGYVGYNDTNFCDKLRQNPNSIILFDEIEKAHEEVRNVFFKALGEGYITDSRGVDAKTTNCLIFITSNIGVDTLLNSGEIKINPIGSTEERKILGKSVLLQKLKGELPQSFMDRINNVCIFNPFNSEEIDQLIDLGIKKTVNNLKNKVDIDIKVPKQFAMDLRADIDKYVSPTNPFSVRMIENRIRLATARISEDIIKAKKSTTLKFVEPISNKD